ncbi:hypothetical protein EDM56_18475 [Brevibacillus fluminis]|uniref:Uncharacterized protein n=1 Tax=Brevibacillus fluminis TaxID=511487 RepID=A0A3M8DD30_9BACL|nr:hypothetical protein EDM56_18475 [Brevibacillus fluminis]
MPQKKVNSKYQIRTTLDTGSKSTLPQMPIWKKTPVYPRNRPSNAEARPNGAAKVAGTAKRAALRKKKPAATSATTSKTTDMSE